MTFIATREERELQPLKIKPRGSMVLLEKRVLDRPGMIHLDEKTLPTGLFVAAVGDGVRDLNGKVQPVRELRVGDRVLCDLALQRIGTKIVPGWLHETCAVTGKTYMLVPDEYIQGVVEGDSKL